MDILEQRLCHNLSSVFSASCITSYYMNNMVLL